MPPEIKMSHIDLVARARKWLLGSMGCGVVLCEVIGGGLEQPDAIGWKNGGRHSILVEVKVSRSDFLSDKKKCHRRAGAGMGQQRWYLTPPGLVRPDELPDGWGLAEAGRVVKKIVKPPKLERYDPDIERRETALMFSALRKVTLGIKPDRFGDWCFQEPLPPPV